MCWKALTAYGTNEIAGLNHSSAKTTITGTAIRSAVALAYSNILNQNLAITYASDNGVDITEDMNDWTLRFVGKEPSGEAQAWNDLLAVTGTWSMAEGSSSINIAYNTTISQAVFLSRQWTIGGGMRRGAEIVLIAADGDEVHLLSNIQ